MIYLIVVSLARDSSQERHSRCRWLIVVVVVIVVVAYYPPLHMIYLIVVSLARSLLQGFSLGMSLWQGVSLATGLSQGVSQEKSLERRLARGLSQGVFSCKESLVRLFRRGETGLHCARWCSLMCMQNPCIVLNDSMHQGHGSVRRCFDGEAGMLMIVELLLLHGTVDHINCICINSLYG